MRKNGDILTRDKLSRDEVGQAKHRTAAPSTSRLTAASAATTASCSAAS